MATIIRVRIRDNEGYEFAIDAENEQQVKDWVYETIVRLAVKPMYHPIASITLYEKFDR